MRIVRANNTVEKIIEVGDLVDLHGNEAYRIICKDAANNEYGLFNPIKSTITASGIKSLETLVNTYPNIKVIKKANDIEINI